MKKKILFVIHQMNFGGVQKSVITALNSIDYEKYDVTLYVRKNRTDLLSLIQNNQLNIIVNRDKSNYYHHPFCVILTAIGSLFKLFGKQTVCNKIDKRILNFILKKQAEFEAETYLKNNYFDIAISYIQGYTAQFTAQYVNAEEKFVFFHGSEDEKHTLHSECFKYFNKIIGVNENICSLLKQWYPAYSEKITYLTNYVDYNDIRNKAKEVINIKRDNRFTIATCGRLAPVKGYDIALGAAEILYKQGFDFKWYFIGDGPERQNIENMIRSSGLIDKIEITGMKKNPYPYIDLCDIYVQPSRAEANPLVIDEAKILYKPVVSTATVGGKKLLRHNIDGILTEISPEALADGIICLYDNNFRNMCIGELKKSDYSLAEDEYRKNWDKLLGGSNEIFGFDTGL